MDGVPVPKTNAFGCVAARDVSMIAGVAGEEKLRRCSRTQMQKNGRRRREAVR